MRHPIQPDAIVAAIAKIDRCDRWQVHQRLQELSIACWCPEDGQLWVAVENCLEAILLRSAIQPFTTSRIELVDWLERCWNPALIPTYSA
jgi:hypothetical protein